MRLYAEAKRRKKGLVYTASCASMGPLGSFVSPVEITEELNRIATAVLGRKVDLAGEKEYRRVLSRATFYLHPLYTAPRKRGPGKKRHSRYECHSKTVVHHWPTEYAERIYDWMFHPYKGTNTNLLKTKTSEEIVELFLARKRL